MKPVYRFAACLLICVVAAVAAYVTAMGMIDSLYAYRSPLKDNPPLPGERTGLAHTRRVVFVLVDALRYDTSQNAQLMPTLARLRQQGAAAQMHSQPPSYSEPGYTTLLTGAWPYLNDGPALNLDYDSIPTWTQDNLFSAANRAGLKTAVSAYYWFEKLIPQAAVTARFYTPGEDSAADDAVLDAALPWLADPQYALVLIHLDQVDYAGHHQGGPRDPNWNAAAARVDAQIAQIAAQLDLAQDTILIVSDHGQISQGGHGGTEAITLVEPFILTGAGVKAGEYGSIDMIDLAPTLAALLGLNIPASSQGLAQTDMLNLTPGELAAVRSAEAAQQSGLYAAYLQGRHVPVQTLALTQANPTTRLLIAAARAGDLNRERGVRALFALLFTLLIAGLGYLLRVEWSRWSAISAGLYLLLFNILYLVISQRTYSFSSVRGSVELVLHSALLVAVSLTAGWLLMAWRTGLFRQPALIAAQKTLDLVLVIIAILALPVLVGFVISGLFAGWTLPEPISFFVAFMALVQGLLVGLIGALLSGLAAIISRLTALINRITLARA